jgi:threonine dehydratase
MVTFTDVKIAHERISSQIQKTPCCHSHSMSELLQANVYLKLESMQYTGSFKERGALNKLMLLGPSERACNVVTASAGNHAQAVAYHAQRLGIVAHIFMPKTTPMVKVLGCERFKARIQMVGENYDDAYDAATQFSKNSGAIYVHAYDDPVIIAGQGSVGIEIAEQLPNVDAVVVPVGGGGLISGIAIALQHLRPGVKIVGVEASTMPSMAKAISAGSVVTLPNAATLADGIRVRRVGESTLAICRELIKQWVVVDDRSIAHAILHLLERERTVAEAAGAAGVSALLNGSLENLRGKNICVVIGGGNIDVNLIARIIERGLVESGRLVQLNLKINDRPGELAELLRLIGASGANVFEVIHERAFGEVTWGEVAVDLVLETKGFAHIEELLAVLKAKGYRVTRQET